jgi:hypothetical protein
MNKKEKIWEKKELSKKTIINNKTRKNRPSDKLKRKLCIVCKSQRFIHFLLPLYFTVKNDLWTVIFTYEKYICSDRDCVLNLGKHLNTSIVRWDKIII